MRSLLIATRNRHKVEEIQKILGAEFQYLTLNDFPGAPEVREDADSFAGNARLKAMALADWIKASGQKIPDWILADDSGLEVDALQGAPGVHSARFAADDKMKGNSPDSANNEKLMRLLRDIPADKKTARFRCVLAAVPAVGGEIIIVDGSCEGRIAADAGGQGGFGYDPLFIPDGYNQSFAQLGGEIKNRLSHRARALSQLKPKLGISPAAGHSPGA